MQQQQKTDIRELTNARLAEQCQVWKLGACILVSFGHASQVGYPYRSVLSGPAGRVTAALISSAAFEKAISEKGNPLLFQSKQRFPNIIIIYLIKGKVSGRVVGSVESIFAARR